MLIKIYASYHKQCEFPKSPLIVPVQAGRAASGTVMGEYCGDDTGDNISLKNPDYCELTVHYWAWKNSDADYIGFCHYRRFFCFGKKTRYPYVLVNKPDMLEKYMGDTDAAVSVISSNDIITVAAEEMHISVREHFERYDGHGGENLRLAMDILLRQHPEFRSAAEEYLNGTKHYFCNMYIMKKQLFDEYCQWLFPVLEEFDRQKNNGSAVRGDRGDGFLAERLFGIYYTWLCQNTDCRHTEVPRADVTQRSRLLYSLLPPASRRRYWVKKLFGRA